MIKDLYVDKETGEIYEESCHGKFILRKLPVVVYRDLDDEVWVMTEHLFYNVYNGRFEEVQE